jgi:T5SS/PEP-CTERM-associated repeat protein/autotransporter-associated beta strand protein
VVEGGYATDSTGYLGYNAGSVGTATVSSGAWSNGISLFVGYGGTGTLNLDGGSVTNQWGYVGGNAGSIGVVTITGGTWDNTGIGFPPGTPALTVGYAGTGTLTMSGGRLTSTHGALGNAAGSVGTATVTGGTWATSGNLAVGKSGTGSLSMSGGLVSVAGTLSKGAAGTINVNAGGTLQIGVGSTGGVLAAAALTNNGTLVFNSSGNSTFAGIVSGTGSIVKQGSGTLNLTGTSAAGPTVMVASNITVSAGQLQSLSGTGNLAVGSIGTATLTVNGGSVTNAIGYLGYDAGTIGNATVSSGTWAHSGSLNVGQGGRGLLTLNGGSVTSFMGFLGSDAGSDGTVTVTGGEWTNYSSIFVGQSGTGTLTVTGGSITNRSSYVGSNAGGVGTVTVTGGTWASTAVFVFPQGLVGGDVVIGSDGIGTLTVSGGLVSAASTLAIGRFGTLILNDGGTLQIGAGDAGGIVNNGALVFDRANPSTFSRVVSGSGEVVTGGAGALTLAGANTYAGVTTISGGTLALSGSGSIGTGGLNLGTTASPGVFDLSALMSGTYWLPSTGDLAGAGTLAGDGKTLAVLGSFLPGNSPGTVALGPGFTLDLSSSGTSVFQITSPLYTAGSFDLVNGAGSVIFGGILRLDFSGGFYANGTDVVQLFANTGGLSGDFSAVMYTGLAAGQSASFNAATGFVTIVPEPTTYAMALAGLACGGYSMLRRRKRA